MLLLLLLQRSELLEKYPQQVDLLLPLDRLPLEGLQISQDLPRLCGRIQAPVFRLVLKDELKQLHELLLHRGRVVDHIVLRLFLSDQLHQNEVNFL